jgi:glycosyltransferase involved in cell wall biosynthesis
MVSKTMRRIRVLHAPLNFANQAYVLSQALRREGIDSTVAAYKWGRSTDTFEFDADTTIPISFTNWLGDEFAALGDVLSGGYDIVHLWNRSLIYHGGGDTFFSGLDLPYLRSAGSRIAYRFTGYELRRRSEELALNPFSPFRYGFQSRHREERQKRYLDFLAPYVDAFIVQDPEMQSYLPQARIVPRAVDLDQFPRAQPATVATRPLVVHAPTDRLLKGTDFVLRAVEALKSEGLEFEFQLVEKMPHAQAVEWYRRADIVIDQLLIGWYGMVAIEAMAMGKTVVAYIRDDLKSFFRRGMPLLAANPETIADVLREAIGNSQLRAAMADKGRAFVEEVHDSRVVAGSLAGLYQDILAAPAAPVRTPDLAHQIECAPDVVGRLADRRRFINFVRRLEMAATIEPEAAAAEAVDVDRPIAEGAPPPGSQAAAGVGWISDPWSETSDRLSQFEREQLTKLQTEVIALRYKALRYDEIRTLFPTWRSKANRYDRLVSKGWYRLLLPLVGLLLAPVALITAFREDRARRHEVELLLKLSTPEVAARLASETRRTADATTVATSAA